MLCASAALAQDLITPAVTVRRRAALAAASAEESKSQQVVRGFGGTGANFATGAKQQANVETKVLAAKMYGPLSCVADPADANKEICKTTTLFSFEINSYMVDAAGQQLVALKEYLLSSKGSPVSLRLPLDWRFLRKLTFSTYKDDTLPQSWIGAKFLADARLIPQRLASGADRYNYSTQVTWAWEGHGVFDLGDVRGTAFFTLAPSFNYAFGDSLVAALLPSGAEKAAAVFGIAYSGGYQFGGEGGTAFRFSGARSFTGLRGGIGQVTLGLRRAIGPLKPKTGG